MTKAYTFTTRHYPANDLLALDLQDHLDSMAKLGWELVSTQQLINKHSATTPQMIFFWGKDGENRGEADAICHDIIISHTPDVPPRPIRRVCAQAPQ